MSSILKPLRALRNRTVGENNGDNHDSSSKNWKNSLNTRTGFFLLTLFLFWIKTYFIYLTKFNLGLSDTAQKIILFFNPIPVALLLLGIALYFRGKKFYWILLIIDLLSSLWLFANILYYREFSDFLSIGIIKSSSSVSNHLGLSIMEIIHPTDFMAFVDILILVLLLLFKVIKVDKRKGKLLNSITVSLLAVALFGLNLTVADKDRPQLLTRTFDNNYIVKYLGINFYAGYNAYQNYRQNSTRANASSNDLNSVLSFLKKNRVGDNISYYGKAKGKNVFIFHLESFQQFLIDYKVDGQEVTPNINKFYHDQNTLSFDNFFNQVGQGKTSDAETMLENSLFGLPTGSVMTEYGTSNTFQALPAILDQNGYSTAAFHGDVGSFWNRDNTYKSWGYQYFFDEDFYKEKTNYSIGYGLKDKIFLKQAVQYLQQLPQPFYAKIITLTNHYPYELDKINQSIPKTKTGDQTVDGYVQTAHYLDQAFGEFIQYLKKSGLYDNSMIVVYGDHYGISNNHKKAIAQLLNKKSVSSYDLAMFQKVPFMIHLNGLKGGVNHTYGGEIDVMPTLMDLMGLKDDDYIQLGQDLLANNRNQTVAFRDGDFVSPTYSKIGSKVYNNQGQQVTNLSSSEKQQVDTMQNRTDKVLSLSDKIITGDLLRFYTPSGFKKVTRSDYNYKYNETMKQLKAAQQKKKTSLQDKNNGKSTVDLFETDAPELK
ncbi:LTA synthase family protein [Liquorilactobacillus nagelii]|uniref:LTA synthase family protein n=1 Tax=Liquorilactobacillus nagelii TaxID=82688 RepID=UPI0039EA0BF1